eukprot:sb/3462624/
MIVLLTLMILDSDRECFIRLGENLGAPYWSLNPISSVAYADAVCFFSRVFDVENCQANALTTVLARSVREARSGSGQCSDRRKMDGDECRWGTCRLYFDFLSPPLGPREARQTKLAYFLVLYGLGLLGSRYCTLFLFLNLSLSLSHSLYQSQYLTLYLSLSLFPSLSVSVSFGVHLVILIRCQSIGLTQFSLRARENCGQSIGLTGYRCTLSDQCSAVHAPRPCTSNPQLLIPAAVMKGVTGKVLILVGHGTVCLTSGYVLSLLIQTGLANTKCAAFLTYSLFLCLGTTGLLRYTYPATLVQMIYRELSSLGHAVGLMSLALSALEIHGMLDLPDMAGLRPHVVLLGTFVVARALFGPGLEDLLTKVLWAASAIVIFYTGMKAQHWMELIGSAFLVSSFVSFYFNSHLFHCIYHASGGAISEPEKMFRVLSQKVMISSFWMRGRPPPHPCCSYTPLPGDTKQSVRCLRYQHQSMVHPDVQPEVPAAVMKGVTGKVLILVGHGTVCLTSGYVLSLLIQTGLANTKCAAFLTYSLFLCLGTTGLLRYTYPATLVQMIYRELSSLGHAVGLMSLALSALEIHGMLDLPDMAGLRPHVVLLGTFVVARALFGPGLEDLLTKVLWAASAIVIFYTGMKAQHWMELIGSAFLVSSFVSFYFNRTFTDKRVILGINDLVWYLLLLNVALLLIGHSFFSPGHNH